MWTRDMETSDASLMLSSFNIFSDRGRVTFQIELTQAIAFSATVDYSSNSHRPPYIVF